MSLTGGSINYSLAVTLYCKTRKRILDNLGLGLYTGVSGASLDESERSDLNRIHPAFTVSLQAPI